MVYILLAPGFEEMEALVPADLLRRAGLEVALTTVGPTMVPGAHHITVQSDLAVDQVQLKAGDMVVLPGGAAPAWRIWPPAPGWRPWCVRPRRTSWSGWPPSAPPPPCWPIGAC